jgi:hypothetical protein
MKTKLVFSLLTMLAASGFGVHPSLAESEHEYGRSDSRLTIRAVGSAAR